jgi:GNAT superfamily N-acetyltransferase
MSSSQRSCPDPVYDQSISSLFVDTFTTWERSSAFKKHKFVSSKSVDAWTILCKAVPNGKVMFTALPRGAGIEKRLSLLILPPMICSSFKQVKQLVLQTDRQHSVSNCQWATSRDYPKRICSFLSPILEENRRPITPLSLGPCFTFLIFQNGESKLGKIVGCINFQLFHDKGYITNLAVLPSFRRKGIGMLMMSLVQMFHDSMLSFCEPELSNLVVERNHLYLQCSFLKESYYFFHILGFSLAHLCPKENIHNPKLFPSSDNIQEINEYMGGNVTANVYIDDDTTMRLLILKRSIVAHRNRLKIASSGPLYWKDVAGHLLPQPSSDYDASKTGFQAVLETLLLHPDKVTEPALIDAQPEGDIDAHVDESIVVASANHLSIIYDSILEPADYGTSVETFP